jgi:NurA-like 5'-3' nuclease
MSSKMLSLAEMLESHYKEMEAIEAKDKRIAELEKENKELQECFDECYEELRLTRDAVELEKERAVRDLEQQADELEKPHANTLKPFK